MSKTDMHSHMSYADLMRLPKWQKRRLGILERDSWKCSSCGADDKPLNVHHRRYIRGRKPWEYCDRDLMTLCDECHTKTHSVIDAYKALSLEAKIAVLTRMIGPGIPQIGWGPFLIVPESRIDPGCLIFHVPTGLWKVFPISPSDAVAMLEKEPASRSVFLEMILEGSSAV